METLSFCNTKIGRIGLIADNEHLTALLFDTYTVPSELEEKETKIHSLAIKELNEYFDGKRKVFTVPLLPQGTDFQLKVWDALRKIPYGQTASYKEIAVNIGNTNGQRAVGGANNKNKIPIFIPCHRVIGHNGDLVGFGGGLDVKEKLLQIEGIR